MGFLIPTPELEGDERILWRSPAGFTTPRPTGGGTLYATTKRLLFVPNRLNFLSRSRRPKEWAIGQVAAVDSLDRDFTPYTGGMHNRLQVTLRNGEQLLFVVKDLEIAMRELQNM